MTENNEFMLRNGMILPSIGYGTFRIKDGEEAASAVRNAISAGYRLIDTAACYNNESGVGEGVRTCGLPRDEIMVTSKVWSTDRGYDNTLRAFDESLRKLSLGYIDIYLIHWPCNAAIKEDWDEENLSTWKALIKLYKEGLVKAIGVSNFLPKHLRSLMETEIQPMINQVEFHPGFWPKETTLYCQKNGIIMEAWSPLGRSSLLDHPVLCSIAEKHSYTVSQVCLGWELNHGVIPIPKTSSPAHMKANLDHHFLDLTAEEMRTIDDLPLCGGKGSDPDTVIFF